MDNNPQSSEGGDPKRDEESSPPQPEAKENESDDEESGHSTDSSSVSGKSAKAGAAQEQLRKEKRAEIERQVREECGYDSDDMETQFTPEWNEEAEKANKLNSKESAERREKVKKLTDEKLRASLAEPGNKKKKKKNAKAKQRQLAKKQRKANQRLARIGDDVIASYIKVGNQSAEKSEESQEDENMGDDPKDGDPEAAMAKGSKESSPVAERKMSKQAGEMSPESGEEKEKARELTKQLFAQAVPPAGSAPQGLNAPLVDISNDEDEKSVNENMDLDEEQREIEQMAKQLEERKQRMLLFKSIKEKEAKEEETRRISEPHEKEISKILEKLQDLEKTEKIAAEESEERIRESLQIENEVK